MRKGSGVLAAGWLLLAGAVSQGADRAAENAADKDFGKLSDDGVSAFNDVHLARMDLFDGKPEEAASLVSAALTSLEKARQDGAAWSRAEAALRVTAKDARSRDPRGRSTTPIAWLPIDGEIQWGKTYKSTPENGAAVVNANKSLAKGDGAKALETVKLVRVDVDYIVALAPLEQSITDVRKAEHAMTTHDYYGAGEALRAAEEGVRYDLIEDVAHVRSGSKTPSSKDAPAAGPH